MKTLEILFYYIKNRRKVSFPLKTGPIRVSFIQIMQIRVQNKRKIMKKSRYIGDVSPTLVARVWAPFGRFFRKSFLLIPKIISVKYQVIPGTFISAQK